MVSEKQAIKAVVDFFKQIDYANEEGKPEYASEKELDEIMKYIRGNKMKDKKSETRAFILICAAIDCGKQKWTENTPWLSEHGISSDVVTGVREDKNSVLTVREWNELSNIEKVDKITVNSVKIAMNLKIHNDDVTVGDKWTFKEKKEILVKLINVVGSKMKKGFPYECYKALFGASLQIIKI